MWPLDEQVFGLEALSRRVSSSSRECGPSDPKPGRRIGLAGVQASGELAIGRSRLGRLAGSSSGGAVGRRLRAELDKAGGLRATVSLLLEQLLWSLSVCVSSVSSSASFAHGSGPRKRGRARRARALPHPSCASAAKACRKARPGHEEATQLFGWKRRHIPLHAATRVPRECSKQFPTLL